MQSLYILPFDHRNSFMKMLLGHRAPITLEEQKKLADYKKIIWEGFKSVANEGVKERGAILVDEQLGADIHREAKKLGIRTALSMEKSGEKVFDFEYKDWQAHIEKIKPTFVKALVRVHPDNDNVTQNARLRELGEYAKDNGYQFLLEPLVEASPEDLSAVDNDKKRFDAELRTNLFIRAIGQFHIHGVYPDIWKIEGTETREEMQQISSVLDADGEETSIIVLGRGESMEQVEHWLSTSAAVDGVIGFAVGRTVFANALLQLKEGKYKKEEAIKEIGERYLHFIDVFERARG